jgi:hypothetical protein
MTPALYHRGPNVKLQPEQGMDEVGIDWLSLTLPDDAFPLLRSAVAEVDSLEVHTERGRLGFKESHRFTSGVTLQTGHKSERMMLNIPGGACTYLGTDDVVRLASRALAYGGEQTSFTRVDIRRDMRGDGITLVRDILDACRRGELRHAREYKYFPARSADGNQLLGQGVYLGSSKSPRFVRCYDKGLETGTGLLGTWLRFEGQFRNEYSDRVMRDVVAAGGLWIEPAFSHLCGIVDFVPGPRGSGANWSRLPRSPFWSAFIAGGPSVRAPSARRHPDVNKYIQWLHESLPALQAAADELSITVGTALDRLLTRARSSDFPSPLTPHLVAALLERSTVISSANGEAPTEQAA